MIVLRPENTILRSREWTPCIYRCSVLICTIVLSASPSAIRKLHDSVTDPKYDGVRTSRKQLLEESDEDITSDDEDVDVPVPSQEEEDCSENERGTDEDEDSEGADEGSSAVERSGEEATLSKVGSLPVNSTELNGDLASNLRKTREEDREKGKAVSCQIVRHSVQSRSR